MITIGLVLKVLVVLIPGLVLLFKYLLGDKRREEWLRKQITEYEKRMRDALANNDTIRISLLERDLRRMRDELRRITAK